MNILINYLYHKIFYTIDINFHTEIIKLKTNLPAILVSVIKTTINPTLSYSERETIMRDNISGRIKSLKTQLGKLKDREKKDRIS